jgi:hypothetical protein
MNSFLCECNRDLNIETWWSIETGLFNKIRNKFDKTWLFNKKMETGNMLVNSNFTLGIGIFCETETKQERIKIFKTWRKIKINEKQKAYHRSTTKNKLKRVRTFGVK